MEFQSLLGANKPGDIEPEKIAMPKYFYDLNLDQIVQEIMEEQKQYDLRRFYYVLANQEDINYRLEVLRDLDIPEIYQCVVDFSIGIRKAKEYLEYIEATDIEVQKRKWKLDAAYCYLTSIEKLKQQLEELRPSSLGLVTFMSWLETYMKGQDYTEFYKETKELMSQFDQMKYHIQLKRDRIIIKPGYVEEDYCQQLEDIFHESTTGNHYYQKNPFGTPMLSSLEAAILNVLRKPYADTFQSLKEYDTKYQHFINETILSFELESQFYIAFIQYRNKMQEMKYHFCYPRIREAGAFHITRGYDLALAQKNYTKKKEVVFNDCVFNEKERFMIVTGPNQGGKTTYGRAMGQIVYFASIGLMVPCETAALPVYDGIFTHFAVEENLETGAGKLKEELLRLKDMMEAVTPHSFIIINEIFTSATSYDAYLMGKKVLDYFMDHDCLGIYVTHIYELTKEDDRIVSLVAALLNEDSNIRTFKIERRPADGRSYANTIVEKHHMNYQEIKERIRR